MAQVTGPQSTAVHHGSHVSTAVAGSLSAAKDRAGVRGEPNPASFTSTSNPMVLANFQAQLG